MPEFPAIAPYLSNPLVLVGFVLLLFFGIHRTLIKSKIIPPVGPQTGGKIVQLLLRYGFILALVIVVLGFSDAALLRGQVVLAGATLFLGLGLTAFLQL